MIPGWLPENIYNNVNDSRLYAYAATSAIIERISQCIIIILNTFTYLHSTLSKINARPLNGNGSLIHSIQNQLLQILAKAENSDSNAIFIKQITQALNNNPSQDELSIFQDIINIINNISPLSNADNGCLNGCEFLIAILKGAHVHINDADFYYNWGKLSDGYKRISSHPSKKNCPQYSINGPWLHTILFGIVTNKESQDLTFFQLENSAFGAIPGCGYREMLRQNAIHAIDYVKYKARGLNQGPYGQSEFKDKNPILLFKEDDHWIAKKT